MVMWTPLLLRRCGDDGMSCLSMRCLGRAHRLGGNRESKDDRRAAIWTGALDPDPASLRFHEPPRDRQPEPDAAAPRVVRLPARDAEELLEDALAHLGRNPRPFIEDDNPDLVLVFAA